MYQIVAESLEFNMHGFYMIVYVTKSTAVVRDTCKCNNMS